MAMTMESLITLFREATATEMADLLTEMDRGMAIWQARQQQEGQAKPKKAIIAKAQPPPDAPTADSYRMDPATVAADHCQARRLVNPDKRWSTAVYHESQCEKKPVAGSTFCATCQGRKEAYETAMAAGTKIKTNSVAGAWSGEITGEVPGHCHMLCSDWAMATPPTWVGEPSDSASTGSRGRGRPRLTPEEVAARAAAKTNAKAATTTDA